jgi:hypothetical protein
MTDNFWQSKLPAVEPFFPPADGAAYRAWQAARGVSSMYWDRPTPAPPRNLYQDAEPPKQLTDYQSASPVSKYAQRPSESDGAYIQRLSPLTKHLKDVLPADELATVAEQFNAAIGRLESDQASHAQLRANQDARGTTLGVTGLAPQDRAAALGHRGFGERTLTTNGHVQADVLADKQPMSNVAVHQLVREREAAQRGQPPQRTEIPTGSSGEGWMVTR